MTSFVAIVPVKPLAVGKSRLAGLPDDRRVALARAFALDTVAACLASEQVVGVIAVTDDFRFAAELTAEAPDCVVLPDGVSGDLNGSLVQAAHEAVRRWSGAGVAAVVADLPALRPDELSRALEAVPASGFVPDRQDTGTTVYAARSVDDFRPAFGPGSAAEHEHRGAVRLLGEWPTVRQDVDDVGDLGRVLLLGVGPHTDAACER